MSKPNILWISTDQQRWDTLGCYGNSFTKTPNLDKLAEGGVLFTHAYSQSPVCMPSRGCFLTGRYPRTCRARQNGADIPEDEVPVTKILSDKGYICGLSGKLHLSACDPEVCKGTERRIDDGYDQFFWSHDSGNYWAMNEYHQWLQQKKIKYISKRFKRSRYIQFGQLPGNTQTTWCVEKAISFIQNTASHSQPWLYSVNIFSPHHPFDPPESYLNRYLDHLDEIPLPNFTEGELENKPIWQKIDHEGAYGQTEKYRYPRMKEKDHRLVRAAYWAMCDLIDAQVGRLFSVLKETGQYDNTIVIFMADHGEMLGDHGLYLKGPYFYEPAIRVPLLISWPDRLEPKKVDNMVELIDLPQTILEMVGIPDHPGMQGKSLSPLMNHNSQEQHHKDDVYCEYYNAMPWHKDPVAFSTMLRTENYKITVDHSHSFGELYDLKADPNEITNLWNLQDYSEIKMEMLLKLCNRMAFTTDPLPIRRGNY
ncbi:MAG: sulfatase-like hydrolase/transferase [Candidatus Lokiarchaeota archaeon]|nr:sulfatase-like hydrolase/transferase [Candidatus Lokiarchaeota archaeon]MBD3339218.1 sulfatase-like hydrolase/transferase [Candidatus Lokiarchaeota archaeon]